MKEQSHMYLPACPGLDPAYFLRSHAAEEVPFPLNAPNRTYFYRARSAIYHLFRALQFTQRDTVLVPAYHHGNEVRAMRAAGASIRFYPIRRDLEVDLEAVARLCTPDVRALFVIHYLGWPQPMKEIMAFCRERDVLVVEDCALALFSETEEQPLGSFGDYAVYCLYKTLPLPHGGLLVQSRNLLEDLTRLELTPCDFLSVTGRTLELFLDRHRCRSNRAGEMLMGLKRAVGRVLTSVGRKRLPVGDTGFDLASVNIGMSPWCHRLLNRCDEKAIRQKRRDNYLYLLNKLGGRVTVLHKELGKGVCPLFFPLVVPNKRAAAEALWRRGIGAVEFWNEGDPEVARDAFPDAQFLREHILELPIHQDLTPDQMDYLAAQVLGLKLDPS